MSDDYKDSLNLPSTDFPMRGNLPQREPEIIKFWESEGIYQKMIEKAPGESFSMPDGPPYANGNIHIGHVLNKVLKDIVVKYRNLSGRPSHFIPGWDCHGLPIELTVTKKLGAKRKEKSDKEVRDLCRQEAKQWVGTQKKQFIRLGVLADWENPYRTLDPSYEAEEVRELARILDHGILYRGEKPVYWCWALQTALADTEIEYANHKSPAVYVRFNVKEKNGMDLPDDASMVIWTTTPWTLPANLALAVGEDFTYGLFEAEGGHVIIAADLEEEFQKITGLALKRVRTFKGSDLVGVKTQHPFIDRESPVLSGHHVTVEATGVVHTAPGHGADDYLIGKKNGLDVYCPVDEFGKYTSDVPEYEGEFIYDCNPKIIERLKSSGHLIHTYELEHSYPHCWRSKTPLIFRTTPQWFLGVDDEKYNVRKKALDAISDIEFFPSWGEARLRAMIENRPDWCLSRQRLWGVPIPVFYCEDCGTELIEKDTLLRVADRMEQNGGIEAYFDGEIKDFIGDANCKNCSSTQFRKGQDILDVWFDSGICHAAVQKRRDGMSDVADIYLEGSDQHRGWFQTSLLSSIASSGKSPFKALITHGFVNDAKGRKMSKSLGNVVAPEEWIKKSGAEMLRLFAAYEDYGQDLSCGPETLKRITETYRRFRNTMRFLLGNLAGFDPARNAVPDDQLLPLDQWALHKTNQLVEKVTEHYEKYEFYKVYHSLNHFMTVDMSATYLDILKDRLYTSGQNSQKRRSAQTVLHHIVSNLVSLMSPVLSFLAEETYGHIPGKSEKSVFLVPFPKPVDSRRNEELENEMELIFDVRSEILKKIEGLRVEKVIRGSLEAQVEIAADEKLLELLKKYETYLTEFFIVSKVTLKEGARSVVVKTAEGEKCPRCWYISDQIGESKDHPELCPKCVEALS